MLKKLSLAPITGLIGATLFTVLHVMNFGASANTGSHPVEPIRPSLAPLETPQEVSKYNESATLIQTENPDSIVATARARGVGVQEVIRIPNAPAIIELNPGNAQALNELLASLPPGTTSSPNHRYQVVSHFTPNDEHYNDQWNINKIKASSAWDTTTGSSDVVVAVIDTGVLFEQTINGTTYTQPDFPTARRWTNSEEAGTLASNGEDDDGNGYIDDAYGWDFMGGHNGDASCPNHDPSEPANTYHEEDNDPQPYSCDSPSYPSELNKNHYSEGSCEAFESACFVGHGTIVGSTAASETNNSALIAGVNHKATIMNLRVLDGYGHTTTSHIAEAVHYATANGADVINLSLGMSDCTEEFSDPVLENALEEAKSAEIIIVAASGNENTGVVCYPASSSTTIAVGATDINDERPSWSNTGTALDVVAPGVSVPAANAPSEASLSNYRSGVSGTSLATPHVAGLASLLKSHAPAATTEQLYRFITKGADKTSGMDGKDRTDSYGYGRINAAKSLNLATNYSWSLNEQKVYSDQAQTREFTNTITLAPEGKAYIRVKARNTGYQEWDQSFLRIGTSNPRDRQSVFQDPGWLGSARPTDLIESIVSPDSIGTFEFILSAPTEVGSYKECFNLVAEARSWLKGKAVCYHINVVEPLSSSADTGMVGGDDLRPGDRLLSSDKQSMLSLQMNGNIVLRQNFKKVWSSSTAGSSAKRLVMQGDGNLVLYSTNGNPLWHTATHGNDGAQLELLTNGNLVIYKDSVQLWGAKTVHNPDLLGYVNTSLPTGKLFPGQKLETADRKRKLVIQSDGNLVLYEQGKALWATYTVGENIKYLAMQGDGNLVLYNTDGKAVWHTRTGGMGASRLVLQDDSNLVLYRKSNSSPTWHTGTY